jgi:hypothetical protein
VNPVIYSSKRKVRLRDVLDIYGNRVPGMPDGDDRVTFIFADMEPGVAWEHACRYVIVYESGEVQWFDHDLPPTTSIKLIQEGALTLSYQS